MSREGIHVIMQPRKHTEIREKAKLKKRKVTVVALEGPL
jgi:hypothetical protein